MKAKKVSPSDNFILHYKSAFQFSKTQARETFPRIWDELFAQHDLELDGLVNLLNELSDDLDPEAYQVLLETLLKRELNVVELIRKSASFCLSVPGELQQRLANVWGPLLTAALEVYGPEKIAGAIGSLMTSDEEIFTHAAGFLDFDTFRSRSLSQEQEQLLSLPDFQLPAGVILSGLGFQYLIQKTGIDAESINPDYSTRTARGIFDPIVQSVIESGLKSPAKLQYKVVLQLFMEMIKQSQVDEHIEWAVLKMARFTPVGIFLIIASIIYCLVSHRLPWWDLLFKKIENDPKLKVRRLPPPAEAGPKYLIFSDIHRDARSDRREPLEFGSIDHFSSNQALYCELLDYAFDNGFTVLEAGDCDELWCYRDFSRHPEEKLEEIIATHQPVYERLVKLHREGRYIRLYGNHDSCIRKPHVFQVLQNIFDREKRPEDAPFDVYDFAIIDGVKSMDQSFLNFGLDAYSYDLKVPMVVAHGHQWDFWNCDTNNIIGKLIVSAIATPIDFLDDPFIDAGGIAYSGSPVIDFSDMLSKAFVLNSFPAHIPSRRFAHEIQHQDDKQRFTSDDIYFLETLALLSAETIAVKKSADSVETRRMNLICLGHTHYPHSQPYFNLKQLIPFIKPKLKSLEDRISEKTKGLIKPELALIKSRYFNSGTAGWHEGVIWAIQIDESGQARLVYWTDNTRTDRPNTMDWELPLMDEALREKLEAKKGALLNKIEDLSTLVDPIIDSAVSSVIRSLAAPFEWLIDLFSGAPAVHANIGSAGELTDSLLHVFLSLIGSKEPQTHTLRVKLPDTVISDLTAPDHDISQFADVDEADQLRFNCAWLLANQGIPFLGASQKRLAAFLPESKDLNSFAKLILGLIVHLPGMDDESLLIRSHIHIEGNEIVIEIKTKPGIIARNRTKENSGEPNDN